MARHEIEIWNRALARVGDNRLLLDASVAITSATAANPVVFTTPVHGYTDDDLVLIRGAIEMLPVNGRVFKINVLTTTTFELLEEDGTSYNAETTGGGTVERITNSGNKNAQACFDAWIHDRDEVLFAHPWNGVTRRLRVSRDEAATTITGASAANPVQITDVAHGYTTGDEVFIQNIIGMTELNDRWFLITQVFVGGIEDPDLFDIQTEDGTLHTAYISGGTATKALIPFTPDSGFGNRYNLPSDSLRILELVDSDSLWQVEDGELHTDDGDTVAVRYIFRQQDVTAYGPNLVSTLAYRLALDLAEELTQSNTKRDKALQEFDIFMKRSARADGLEQSGMPLAEDDWILRRGGGASPISARTAR